MGQTNGQTEVVIRHRARQMWRVDWLAGERGGAYIVNIFTCYSGKVVNFVVGQAVSNIL